MRYFLILSLSFFIFHNTFAQMIGGSTANYIYKCDSAVGPKSKNLRELSYKNIFQYYADGRLKSDIEYNLNNTTWEPTRRNDYTYIKGKLISDIRSNYNRSSLVWDSTEKTDYQYNSTKQLVKKIYFAFVQSYNQWDTTSLEEYAYSNQGFKVEYIVSHKKTTGFEKNVKFIKYYNSFNLVDSLFQYEYMSGVLKIRQRETYIYDGDGYLKYATMMNSEYGSLQTSNIREVIYDVDKYPTFIEYRPFQKVYYKWDFTFDSKGNNQNTWLPFPTDSEEAIPWFRNGLLTENKIFSRANDTEDWTYTNEGGNLYYSRIDNLSSISQENHRLSISLSPNPTTGLISIKVSSDDEPLQSYSLKNAHGITILEEINLYNSSTIDISQISAGAYILELNIAGEKYYKKIIKN